MIILRLHLTRRWLSSEVMLSFQEFLARERNAETRNKDGNKDGNADGEHVALQIAANSTHR